MLTPPYEIPTTVRLSVQFTRVTDATPVDPDTVTLLITRPGDLGETDYSNAIRDGVGAYHYDVLVDVRGHWRYQWRGDGTVSVTSHIARFRAE